MKTLLLSCFILIPMSFYNLFPQWTTNPNNNLIIGYGQDPEICSDSAGGCYVTYESDYPTKLSLRRIDKYGSEPWGYKKEIIGEFEEQLDAQIIEDGDGGVIISYGDHDLHSSFRLRIQKVNSSGNFLWGQTGVRVTLAETDQGVQKIVSDGAGGAVIIWIDTLAEYRINRINSLGQRMWGDSGIVLGINGYYDKPILIKTTNNKFVASAERNTFKYFDMDGNVFYTNNVTWLENIISDGQGGIIITSRGGQWPYNWQLRSQRKDSLGNNLWQDPYIVVAESLYINTINTVINNNEYYYFSWIGKKNGIDRVVQFQGLKPDGSKLFANGSLAVSNYPVDALLGGILPSDSLSVVLVWEDFRQNDGVFAQRIDSFGMKLWDTIDIRLYDGAYADLITTTDGNGGVIGIGWHQFDFSIRIFKVSKSGVMGEVITGFENHAYNIPLEEYFLYQNYPNPFNSSTTIKYNLTKEGSVKIHLYNILGEKILIIYEGEQKEGEHEISFISDDLPSGIYLYSLETNSIKQTKKLTFLK